MLLGEGSHICLMRGESSSLEEEGEKEEAARMRRGNLFRGGEREIITTTTGPITRQLLWQCKSFSKSIASR